MAAVQFRTPQRFILLLSIVGKVISEPTITSSCADVSIKEGESTSLQCTFTEDIVNLHKDFKVDLYPNTYESVPVLLCHWSPLGKLDCYEHDGYTYGGYEGNTVTINILRASRADTGKYACVLLSYSTPGTFEQCSLTVEALEESPTSATTIQAANNNSDGEVLDPNISQSVTWPIIIVLAAIIILLVTIIIGFFIKKRRTASKKAQKTDELLGTENKTKNPNDAGLTSS